MISYFYVSFSLLQSICSEGHNLGHLPFDDDYYSITEML
ncbi:protein of unknown function [Xenorhabdus bovienii]|uniref:Uncharacterized protein n=1 Tax=Xenorhabdus bovienii TaxID=40576 RepID=A0A0B6XF59_XENBV|nr:protein of unknown function [Xenorhabdus bovienii]